MEPSTSNDKTNSTEMEFHKYAWTRIIAGVLIAAGLLWGLTFLIDQIRPSGSGKSQQTSISEKSHEAIQAKQISASPATGAVSLPESTKTQSHQSAQPIEPKRIQHPSAKSQEPVEKATGVEFVEALIKPLDFEINHRFYGWRPNDIINFTDNVNNFQLGVLEVTRRAATRLTDNISRTGSTATLNPHLEQAMNGFMMNSGRYLFPSAEAQYNDSLEKLKIYKEQLEKNEVTFYNRPDNLIPLLKSFEELLGSCDENLVKTTEEDGKPVSTFMADDYFYYAKGVASAMTTILEAVDKDFDKTLDMRNGKEILHHAIESCKLSASLEPWLFITEANLNGIFANHRANMAAHISHARFYVGLLAQALST